MVGGGGEYDEGTFYIVSFEREYHMKSISPRKHRVSKTSEPNVIIIVVVVVRNNCEREKWAGR